MTPPHKAPLSITEPKAQKNPYGLSVSGNEQIFQSVLSRAGVPPTYDNGDRGRGDLCVGSSGVVNAVNQPKI